MIFGYRPGVPKVAVVHLPLIGMLMFIILYIVAAVLYPGGSWRFPNATEFSFWNNYLCDLLDQYAISGELNQARHAARVALGFLCASLLLLWYFLPLMFPGGGLNKAIMWVSGILALSTTFFLSSGTHDLTVRIAGFFGVLAFIGCFVELYRIRYLNLFYFGIACLLIFIGNYYIYETGVLIRVLPIVQKATFICCIYWFVLLNLALIRKVKQLSPK